MDKLEKIDLIKDRLNVSYEKANNTLNATDGDVIEALVKLEKDEKSNNSYENEEKNLYQVKGQEMLDKIKDIIKQGNVSKISVKNKNNKTLVEIPVTAGVVSLVLFPYLGILAGLTAMYKEYTLKIEREKSTNKTPNNDNLSDEDYYPFKK